MEKVKKYEELTFDDAFMFGKVMNNNIDICKDVLRVITGQEPGELIRNEREFDVKITAESKGVRYDVYVEDDKTMFDTEMQKGGGGKIKKNLPRRSRYYQDLMDLHDLESGNVYTKLKQCVIIFICKFDPFGEGQMVYTFRNACKEMPELEIGDGVTKIFINAKAKKLGVRDGIAELAELINHNKATGELSSRIQNALYKARTVAEWRTEYMNMTIHDMDVREEGIEKGLEQGLEQGREEGLLQGRQEIALNLLRLGTMPIEDIAKCTGLSVDELNKMQTA